MTNSGDGIVDAVLLGAGNRGHRAYGTYAREHLQGRLRFVAVAEPDDARRARFADLHDIPSSRQFRTWEDLVAEGPLARAAINTTMDRTHLASTEALLETGYDVLLEKPMATRPQDCVELVQQARALQRRLVVCHVLRYAPFFQRLRHLVASGRLGDVVSIDWRENLSYQHFVHSFVRGNWSNAGRTAPMILAKCSHDLDQLYWLLGRSAERVSSFGSLTHFVAERALPDMPERCTDGCPHADDCLWYAPRLYTDEEAPGFFRDAASIDHSETAMLEALRTGPYGRCVYRSDNDAVDHQVVMLDFGRGLTVSLTMQGASHVEGRTVRVDGMRATLLANQAKNRIEIFDHGAAASETIEVGEGARGPYGAHGGGDGRLLEEFVAVLRGERTEAATEGAESLESHLLAFAAEESRRTGETVDMGEYRAALGAP
ncbi:MAG: Gfo/Idh/MocA family oxidoreductase [Candidatus Dormiibacterota bacterium]